MAENFDPESGEIIERAPPRMPPEIAGAVIKVMKAARKLGTDERNEHGKYAYVSIDKFLETFGPLMADAGLMMLVDEPSIEVKSGGKEGNAWLFPRYEVWLAHESGVMWGPLHRHIALPVTGPQTFGAAESYVQKRLLRALFMVPTGDKDADDSPQDSSAPTQQRAAPPARQAPAQPPQRPAATDAEKAWAWLRQAIDEAPNKPALWEIDPNLADPAPMPQWEMLKTGAPQHYPRMVKRWEDRLAAVMAQVAGEFT